MSGENLVLLSKDHLQGQVWIITIARPEVLNAVNRKTAKLLTSYFREFDRDVTARVAILTGEGGNFCAGADLVCMDNELSMDFADDGPMGPTRMVLSKPVIACISGYAVAGGLELACWCDLRVGDETSVLGVFCRLKGVPLIDGGTVRLPKLIGRSRAMDLILTGRTVRTKEAFEIGLLNYLAPPGQTALEFALQNLVGLLCKHPQLCMRNDRLSVLLGDQSERKAMIKEFEYGMQVVQSEEFQKKVQQIRSKPKNIKMSSL
jgi:enoyl-CoA hydratase